MKAGFIKKLMHQIAYADPSWVLASLLIFSIMTAINAAIIPGLLSELIPVPVRYSILGLSFNISFGIFDVLTPYLCLLLIHSFNDRLLPGYYLTACAVITFLLSLSLLIGGLIMSRLGEYAVLEQKELRTLFLDYIESLEIPLIDYVAIGVQDNLHRTSTSMMSRPDWQSTFKKGGFAKFDPIRKASFNTRNRFFAFEDVNPEDSFGKEIMLQRKRHEIENGMVIMDRQLGHNFMLTLATGYKNFKPHQYYLDYKGVISKIFDDLKLMVKPSTLHYQPCIYHAD